MQTDQPVGGSLQTEVDIYQQHQIVLEGEIQTLIDENHRLLHENGLLQKQAAEFGSNSEQQRQAKDDLEYRISFLIKERDSLLQLWQTSQKAIEALETELKTYQTDYRRSDSRRFSNDRLDKELQFSAALEQITKLEKKLEEEIAKSKKLENELKVKEEDEINHQKREKVLEDRINEIQNELKENKEKFDSYNKNNADLICRLESTKKELILLVKREAEAKSKVEEALHLLDIVTAQKEEACDNALRATEELAFVKSNINAATGEIENQLRTELDEVKERYDEKISDMLTHIQTLDAELVEKGLFLAKTLRENKVLKHANETLEKQQADSISSVEPRLAIANQKIEAVFQELVLSERRNIRLVSEKQSLVLDAQRQHDTHAREIKRRDWEHKLLSTEISDAKLQIEHLQKSLEESDAMVSKLQALLTSKKSLIQREASSKENEVTALNEHVQKQIELNKKWRQSYVDMTEKLKKRLEELHKENQRLKSEKIPAKHVRYKDSEFTEYHDSDELEINLVQS